MWNQILSISALNPNERTDYWRIQPHGALWGGCGSHQRKVICRSTAYGCTGTQVGGGFSIEALDYLEKNGCFGRVVSIAHLEDLRNEVRSLMEDGKLDGEFFKEWIAGRLDPKTPRGMAKARSIFVTATPVPGLRVSFEWKGETIQLKVPPTYGEYTRVITRSRRLLAEAFAPKKYWTAPAVMPVKLLAVRSGLATYGRNNVTYIPKFGSFHALAALYSSFDSPEDHWQEKIVLPKCSACKACLKACPTGAICEDRFLIHAERCLSRFNERDSSCPFPDWIDDSAHNALVGCMHCQRVCPYDKDVADWFVDRGRFSEEDTRYLLRGKFTGSKAVMMDRRLRRVGLDLTVFPRNLEVHLRQRSLL